MLIFDFIYFIKSQKVRDIEDYLQTNSNLRNRRDKAAILSTFFIIGKSIQDSLFHPRDDQVP